MFQPLDATTFLDTMVDLLRLPEEALAMCYVYSNKYKRFQAASDGIDPLDAYTLALASLSLASKSTECPRRMREILFPAHRLLHHVSTGPAAIPLTVPSARYDTLRATLVQAELLLLRALGFQLRLPLPLDYLPRYLERALGDLVDAAEDYDAWGKEDKEEYGVVNSLMETSIGKTCKRIAIAACKDYQVSNFFPARTIALGCLYVGLMDRGLSIAEKREVWVWKISSGKVDVDDFEEVIQSVEKVI